MSDPIGDLLIRIKNGYMARKSLVEAPWSKILEETARVLVACGYLKGVKVTEDKFKTLTLSLKYKDGKPALNNVKRVSKPGVRRYIKAGEIKPVINGLGIAIISTSKGLMIGQEARKQNLGGEILAEIW